MESNDHDEKQQEQDDEGLLPATPPPPQQDFSPLNNNKSSNEVLPTVKTELNVKENDGELPSCSSKISNELDKSSLQLKSANLLPAPAPPPQQDSSPLNNNKSSNEVLPTVNSELNVKENDGELPSCSSKNSNKLDKSSLRLKSSNLCNKLLVKRLHLQQQEKSIQNNKDALKENDLKAFKALQTMSKKPLADRNNTMTSATLEDDGKAVNGFIPNGLVANCTLPTTSEMRPLHHHSKRQLEGLVEGLQELVYKLTLNDKTLKSKVEHLAVNINGLQNFPLFVNASSSKQRHDSDYYQVNRRNSTRHDSEMSVDSSANEATRKDQKKNKAKIEKVEKLTPAQVFVQYINTMISEYLGEQQKDLIEKLKCQPSMIEDLETYASSLVQAGLGRIVEDEIRINRKNNRQAFVTMSTNRDTTEGDGIVLLPVARRYAFEGDIVRAFVLNPGGAHINTENVAGKKPRTISTHITGGHKDNSISLADDEDPFDDTESSPESDNDEVTDLLDTSAAIVADNCRKCFVIKIVKQTELREIVGSISFMKTTSLSSKSYYKLKPHDMRVPMVYIPKELCKEHIKLAKKEDIVGMLYLARVMENVNGHCIGELVQPVGRVGNLEAEIKAILMHNGMKNLKPYEQKFHDMYDTPMPVITEGDLKNREDLRKKCVFTIDPLTARDLDDAVSVEKLNENEYEIGVHISDVTYYLKENCELDNLVKERATSIYLVNEVIHMLPPSLCFRCSLLPGEDKFAFSVFWRWNLEKEEIIGAPRFSRSVINSCSQFAYEHAQKVIDNPLENFERDDFPEIFNMWTPGDIKWRILLLHQISQKLKAQRYASGALSINNPKLRFQLDPITGEPLSYEVEGRQEANFLIEEFMLLANQSVAKFIHDRYPDISFLRNHSPPLQKSMKVLRERLSNMGLEFDISSSKSIYESMQRLCREASDPKAMDACLSTLLTKPMARARYYCSEDKTSDADFWHYALSIPIYTHFTSPIRRYPDILVHRLLAAALNYCPTPKRTTDELHQLAKICNDQKFNAKNAGDESIELFFTRYVKAKQTITLKAVVTDIFKHMLNVVTLETGHSLTITYKLQKVLVNTTNVPSFILISERNSSLPSVKLQLFSTVDINLTLRNDKICGFFASPDIIQRRINSKESSKKDKLAYNNTANGDDSTRTTSSKSKKAARKNRKSNKKESKYAVRD